MLPDQDWLAFGFWLTAPDDAPNGVHRLGVFYEGMDTYGYSPPPRITSARRRCSNSIDWNGDV